jgi:hypothetical protein
MRSTARVVLAAGVLSVCAIGVGVMAHERALVIPKPDRATSRGVSAGIHAEIERREHVVPAGHSGDDRRWRAQLEVVDTALAQGQVDVAVRAWRDAYAAALASRGWESMFEVGDAYVRIGNAAGLPSGARMNAREAYMSGLIRARRSRSVDGLIRSTYAFDALGDRAIADRCLSIAAWLAEGDLGAQATVREVSEHRAALHASAAF